MTEARFPSLSSGLLVGSAAFALGSLVAAWPIAPGGQSWTQGFGSLYGVTWLATAACVPVVYMLGERWRRIRNGRRLGRTSAFDWSSTSLTPEQLDVLRSAYETEHVEVRRDFGEPVDHGGAVVAGPIAAYALRSGSLRRIVFVPPLVLRRLSAAPRSLAAVLAHELAHFRNADIQLLQGTARVVVLSASAAAACTAMRLFTSQARQTSWSNVADGLTTILFLTFAAVLVRKLRIWREALADRDSAAVFGAGALSDAVMLLEGTERGALRGSRATDAQQDHAVRLPMSSVVVAGALIYVLADRLARPASDLLANWPLVTAFVLALVMQWTSYSIALLCLETTGTVSDFVRAAALMLGVALGGLLTQATYFVPSNSAEAQIEPTWFVTFVVATSTTAVASSAIFVVIGRAIADSTGRWAIGFLPCLTWTISSIVERDAFPTLAEGWLAVICTGAVTVFIAIRTGALAGAPRILFALAAIVPFAAVSLLGYGEASHLADCSDAAADTFVANGDMRGGVAARERAARRAPQVPEVLLRLANELQASDPHRALAVAEASVHAAHRTGFLWDEFPAHDLAASIAVSIGDLARAQWHAREACVPWVGRSRSHESDVASACAKCAVVSARRGDRSTELGCLLRAAELEPEAARQALSDPSLAEARLDGRAVEASTATVAVDKFLKPLQSSEEVIPALRPALENGVLTRSETIALLNAALGTVPVTQSGKGNVPGSL